MSSRITPVGALLFEAVGYVFCVIIMMVRIVTRAWYTYGEKTHAQNASDVLTLFGFFLISFGTIPAIWKNAVQVILANDPMTMRNIGLPFHKITWMMKLMTLEAFTAASALWVLKGALIAMVWDIKEHLDKYARWCLYLSTAYLVIAFIPITIVGFLSCIPFDRQWTVGTDVCSVVNFSNLMLLLFGIAVADFLIVCLLPFLLIRPHRANLTKSITSALAFCYFMFFVALGCAIARTVVMRKYSNSADLAVVMEVHKISVVELLTMIQLGIALLTTCAPQMRAFWGGERDRAQGEFLGILPKDVGALIIYQAMDADINMEEVTTTVVTETMIVDGVEMTRVISTPAQSINSESPFAKSECRNRQSAYTMNYDPDASDIEREAQRRTAGIAWAL